LALNDFTSGFNIATHITHKKKFSALCGFTEDEIKNCLATIGKKDDEQSNVVDTMRQHVNGYRFHLNGATVYNPTMALRYLISVSNE
jgi:hypothetical protein